MGFWSTVGDVASGVGDAVKKHADKVNALKETYRDEDVEFLRKKVSSGSSVQKLAAAGVLKEKGYSIN